LPSRDAVYNLAGLNDLPASLLNSDQLTWLGRLRQTRHLDEIHNRIVEIVYKNLRVLIRVVFVGKASEGDGIEWP